MAKITTQKAGKNYRSNATGATINKGEQYKKISHFRGPTYYFRHDEKIPKKFTTQSEFLSVVYDAQDQLENFNHETSADEIEAIKSELEQQRDELEGSFDNLPEQFQDAEVGERLQSRIEAVDEAMENFDDLESHLEDKEDKEEFDYEAEEPEREDYETEEEYNEAVEEYEAEKETEWENYLEEYNSEFNDLASAIIDCLDNCE